MSTTKHLTSETILAFVLLVAGVASIVWFGANVKPNLKPCVCDGVDTCVYHARIRSHEG